MSEAPNLQEAIVTEPTAKQPQLEPLPIELPPPARKSRWVWGIVLVGVIFVVMAVSGSIGVLIGRQFPAVTRTAVPTFVPFSRPKDEKASDSDSEKAVRAFLENIRARRPEAAYKLTTRNYRDRVQEQDFLKLLGNVPLPERLEAIGAELKTLPPIDEKTHSFRYQTQTIDGKPVIFTVTIVQPVVIVGGDPWWQVDQFLVDGPRVEPGKDNKK